MASLKKFRRVYFTFVLIYLFNIGITNSSKLDHISGHSQGRNLCNSVKSDFSSLKLETNHDIYIQGKICGGQCCSNNTEFDLKNNAVQKFSAHIKHHTKNLQDVLEKTVYIFQRHILESINQSKNKSLNVFSMVYPAKKSEILLNKLYSVIIEDIQPTNFVNWLRKKQADNSNIENTLNNFFTDLFPLGYHKAINLNYETDGDFHNDYISCLKHAYLDLEPFGSVTNELKLNLESNLLTINDFSNGLLESAKVLSSINKIDLSYLSTTCENQLLKMTYCPICKDISLSNAKICHSYCLNVMRGCLAQLGFSEIDQSWSKVAIEIESLVTNNIQSTNGVLKSIKTIDNLLSTAIMNIMKNGPYLKEKVNINCGSPSFVKAAVKSTHPLQFKINSTSTPTDFLPELLSFLTTISNSKHIYTNIVNSLCSDSNVKNTDIHCWTGDHIDDYSYPLLMPGGAQKYNPEVPLSKDHSPDSPILRELVDKLYKISSSLGNNNPTTRYSDIQGDMADNDEESSGQYDQVNMDDDDDDDASGSGENPLDAVSSVPPLDASEDKNSTSSIFRSFHSRLVLLFICYFLLAIKS